MAPASDPRTATRSGRGGGVPVQHTRRPPLPEPKHTPETAAQYAPRMSQTRSTVQWVGIAIDCADAGPVARFYERLLGFEVGDFDPPGWAQLRDPAGGVHLNIQGQDWYEPPTWPERSGLQAKMMHFEVRVDDLPAAITTALEAGGTEAPWQPPDRNPERIRIMLDPAGHPLCLFLPGE